MKVLLTDLAYLHHNYGAQGILIPFLEALRKKYIAEVTVTISDKTFWKEDLRFAQENNFKLLYKPRWNFSKYVNSKQIIEHQNFQKKFKEFDLIIDISGIEFIGNLPFLMKWKDLLNNLLVQKLAVKNKKPYYKFTKSYGPFKGFFYRLIIRKYLNMLPFIHVRTGKNFHTIKKMNLKIESFCFPDISLVLKPASEDWADNYLSKYFPTKGNIIGISPSVVINNINKNENNCCGENNIILIERLITELSKNSKILIIPHSVGDGKNLKTCDLALSKQIYQKFHKHSNVKIIDDENLTYKQVRAVIGKMDFYITSRYHALASALNMKIPVVSLSWHLKYEDLMNSYLDDFLVVNCRETKVESAYKQILQYYQNQKWFKLELMRKNQEIITKQIMHSTDIIWDHFDSLMRKI
jgi:polysaccharide pyruvyl transferase WcaK-like protein